MSRVRDPSIAPFSRLNMNWLHALILGIIQGCTEFFPISSSAHLQCLKDKLHLSADSPLFDLACHLGTAAVLVIYFRQDIRQLFCAPKKFIPFALALVPLVPAYLLLKPLRELVTHSTTLLAPCLLVTAGLLFFARGKLEGKTFRHRDAVWIGAMQGLALIPGISRSASTIATGLFRGMSTRAAVRFSFLLSIPAIGGGAVIEAWKLASTSPPLAELMPCMLGFCASACVGACVIRRAMPLLDRGVFRPFAWYCLIAAILLSVEAI